VHLNWQSTLEAVVRGRLRDGLSLAVGGEGFVATIASKRRTNGAIIPALGDRTEQRAAAFGELAMGSATGATFTSGLRVDWSSVFGTVASPSLAAMLPVGERVQLRASADRGFRAPTWTDRFYVDPANVADSTIGPETFWAGELGLRAFPAWGRVDIAAFTRRAVGLIDYARPAGITPPPVWRTYNFARATYVGLEGQLDLPRVAGAEWTLRGSVLDFTASGTEGFEGKYALRPVIQSYGATARIAPWRGALLALDGRRAARAGEARFSEVNVRLAQDVGRARLLVDALNLFGAQYLDASGVPVMGRGVFVGVEVRR
jgi:iron complex outermembrane receptor protein